MLVYYKVLQGVHGQEIAQNVFRGIIIDPPDPAKLADIDMGTYNYAPSTKKHLKWGSMILIWG